MTAGWWRREPRGDTSWLKPDGFIALAELELVDVDEVRRVEADPDFSSHDEASLLELGEQDRCLDRSRELLRSRRMRARRRGLEEQATAARTVVGHHRQALDEANHLLAASRRDLADIACRSLSDRAYLRRKVAFGVGEAVSLALAFSTAFDVGPLEALLLSGAIALAFVVAGDLGGILRLSADRAGLASVLDRGLPGVDPKYRRLVQHERRPWLTVAGCATAAIFVLAAVVVGLLRAANTGSLGLAAGLGLLTVALTLAAGLSSWEHASVGCEIIDHLQREQSAAARRLRRAARARVIRRYDALGEDLDVRWRATEEVGKGRMRLAHARCAFFRARHPRVFGHGVRVAGSPSDSLVGAVNGLAMANGSLTAGSAASGSAANGHLSNGHQSNGHQSNGDGPPT